VAYVERFSHHHSAISSGSNMIDPPLRFPGMVLAANLAYSLAVQADFRGEVHPSHGPYEL
jgi:hypothetical protein